MILDKSSYYIILKNRGVPNSNITYFLYVSFPSLKCNSLKHLWYIMGVIKITKRIVSEVIEKIVVTKKGGGAYLLKYEEAYILETSEIYGSHGISRYIQTFTDKLQQAPHAVDGKIIRNGIKPASA